MTWVSSDSIRSILYDCVVVYIDIDQTANTLERSVLINIVLSLDASDFVLVLLWRKLQTFLTDATLYRSI